MNVKLFVLYLHTGGVICSCWWVFSFLFYICTQVMSYVACGCLCSFLFCICTQVMSYDTLSAAKEKALGELFNICEYFRCQNAQNMLLRNESIGL